MRKLITGLCAALALAWSLPALAAQGVTITGPNGAQASVTNGGVNVNSTPSGGTTGGLGGIRQIVANNTTSVAVCTGPCTVYAVRVWNNSATIGYLKLYNALQANTTCGSGTPIMEELIPASTAGQGAVISVGGAIGRAFATAATACVTTGIADADTTAPPASSMIYEVDRAQ